MDAPLLVARMLQQCETAKCRLSRQESTGRAHAQSSGAIFAEKLAEVTVTRASNFRHGRNTFWRVSSCPFAACWETPACSGEIFRKLLLVGGATRMPLFVED